MVRGRGVNPIAFGIVFGTLELLSAIFLGFGFLTRLAVLWQGIVLAVAIALIIRGTGKYSVDNHLAKLTSKH